MNDLTTISTLSLFDTNKEQRKTFVDDVLARLLFGEIDPLRIHVYVKCLEDITKNILASEPYKQMVLAEAIKYGTKGFEFGNAQITLRETGVKYDYSQCNDPKLAELYEQKFKIDLALKKREDFLKAAPIEGTQIMVDDEVVTVYPPSKSSTTTPVVSLK